MAFTSSQTDKLVFVGLSPELTVDSGQWTVKVSLRDDFKYRVQKNRDFQSKFKIMNRSNLKLSPKGIP